MPDPVEVPTQPSMKRARKIASVVAVIIIALSFGILYGLSMNSAVTVNVMYVNIVLRGNGVTETIPVQFNHETLGPGEKVYFSVTLKGGAQGLTVSSVSSGTSGFTAGSATALPLTIQAGQISTLKLFFVTPDHDYAGDLTVYLSTS
ncbi:hypothetical protein [Thermoplasma sp.]|uniref:hypothetical protein n=1 Tax=Thermoplasma sp. TaxID=1973142 RepID=UPI0012752291|nr:hypothetical protein [Thermoplasma sp.]KAA8922078.1 MAG: hypothetical protein F6Q11_06150 [Thermoplasma sp.]